MSAAPAGSVASITEDESFIVYVKLEGLTMTTDITRVANAAKGLYDDYGADLIDLGKNVKKVVNIVSDAGNGKVSLGIFQRAFLPPNVPGKFVNFGKGDAIGLGISAAKMSYQIYVAQNTADPLMRKAAYENAAETGVGIGLSVATILFPPAAVIEPTWIATYYVVTGALKVLDDLGWVHVGQGPFSEIAINPAATIVFVVQFESGLSIPSAVALNAFNSAFAYEKELMNDEHYPYSPALLVTPE
jgi:hypothetical protein